MNEQLKNLIELQQIDLKIIDLNNLIGDIPTRIAAAELPLNDSQRALRAGKEKLESLEKRKRDRERALDETGEKVRKLKARTSEIKTNKEYQALLTEIESVEKEQYAVEDGILAHHGGDGERITTGQSRRSHIHKRKREDRCGNAEGRSGKNRLRPGARTA